MVDDDGADAAEVAVQVSNWIREAETAIERLAAESGKPQTQDFGFRDETGRVLLEVHLSCEPRQFAKRRLGGEWARKMKKE